MNTLGRQDLLLALDYEWDKNIPPAIMRVFGEVISMSLHLFSFLAVIECFLLEGTFEDSFRVENENKFIY